MREASGLLLVSDVAIVAGLIYWRRWKGRGKPLPEQLMWLRAAPVVGRIFTPRHVTLKGW